ncbi:MAG: hypothetical protein JWQ79_3505 [Mucilaginibacter sp.]|nr:hypothetical protein [Mucilaginibacter sp.]
MIIKKLNYPGKRPLAILVLCVGALFSFSTARAQQRIGLSNTYPAVFTDWANAFLAGNGKMGIMVFGNPLNETVIYNDRKFNMAKTHDRSFAQVRPEDINMIRDLCAEGKFAEANKLAVTTAQYKNGGEGNRHPGFEMLINIPEAGTISNYSRTCNFRTGEILIKWTDERGNWQRRSFVSRKDNVIVQYLKAPTKGKLTCAIQLTTDPKMNFPANMVFTNVSNTAYLNIRAKYPPNTGDIGYEGVTRVIVSGGKKSISGDMLNITDADSVMLLTRTDKYDVDCEKQWDNQDLQKQLAAITPNYHTLLQGQIATHGVIYDRVKLDLNADATDRARTNEDLLAMQKPATTAVRALWERVFDAGRYYYLSSSSELTPPDLLGIWTGDCNAGWGGYYHLDANLNLQVAGGNIGDMPEAMEGYFKLNEGWKTDFETNAMKLLGCRGMLSAGNSPGTSSGLMANINDYYPYQYGTGEEGWLLYPFWEHYLITGDKVFLKKRLYPLLKDMGYFYEDFLTHTDANGKYIFAGSVSPENQPANLKVSLLNNSGFDISGAKFCLTALLETCRILGLDQGKGQGVEKWSAILSKLPPYLVNSDGAMQEWSWPGLADHYNHRHSSHMLPVWPFREITPENDATLFKAAVTTLQKKDAFNYENAGHGLLHSALIAANLNNAQSVDHKLLRLTREDFYFNSLATSHYPKHNTFCTDVCNTTPAILMEMLASSSPGILELLPALPKELDKGAIAGIKGRNRVTIKNLSWDMTHKTVNCTLISAIDQKITLIERQGIKSIKTTVKVKTSPLREIARVIELKAGIKTNLTVQLKPD